MGDSCIPASTWQVYGCQFLAKSSFGWTLHELPASLQRWPHPNPSFWIPLGDSRHYWDSASHCPSVWQYVFFITCFTTMQILALLQTEEISAHLNGPMSRSIQMAMIVGYLPLTIAFATSLQWSEAWRAVLWCHGDTKMRQLLHDRINCWVRGYFHLRQDAWSHQHMWLVYLGFLEQQQYTQMMSNAYIW